MLGRQGGRQHLTLGNGCHSMATIMHEFTHALGIGHTQAWDSNTFLIFSMEWFMDHLIRAGLTETITSQSIGIT